MIRCANCGNNLGENISANEKELKENNRRRHAENRGREMSLFI